MSIRASRFVADASVSTEPSCLIIGSIFVSPDLLNTYIGTGSGVKQLAYANGVTTTTFSTATPAGNSRVVDAEPVLNYQGNEVITPAGTSIAGVRGNVTIATGTTLTQGYVYGVQGKLTLKGTINESLGEYLAALVGQFDFSSATAVTAVNGLSMLWLDAGASATAGALAKANAINITNSIATNPLHAIIGVPEADAVYFADLNDTADSPWANVTVSKSASGKYLAVKCNGTAYWIPLYS